MGQDSYPKYDAIDALERAEEAAYAFEFEKALHESEAAVALLKAAIHERDNR